ETAASTAASSTVPSAETRSTPVSWLTSTSCTPGTSPTSSRTDISQWPQVMPVTWNWAVVVLMGRLLHRWNISDPIPWRGIGLSLFIPLRGTACKGCRDESGVVCHQVVLRWGHEQRCDHHHPSGIGPPRRRPDLRRPRPAGPHLPGVDRSEEHTSELQSRFELVCRLLLEHTQAES